MVTMEPVEVRGRTAVGITVKMPKTTILAIVTAKGYLMCGVLDVEGVDSLHPERGIVAARAVGVKTVQDLLTAKIQKSTAAAKALGIIEGISGEEAVARMLGG